MARKPMKRNATLDKLDTDAEARLEHARQEFLTQKGWQPGSAQYPPEADQERSPVCHDEYRVWQTEHLVARWANPYRQKVFDMVWTWHQGHAGRGGPDQTMDRLQPTATYGDLDGRMDEYFYPRDAKGRQVKTDTASFLMDYMRTRMLMFAWDKALDTAKENALRERRRAVGTLTPQDLEYDRRAAHGLKMKRQQEQEWEAGAKVRRQQQADSDAELAKYRKKQRNTHLVLGALLFVLGIIAWVEVGIFLGAVLIALGLVWQGSKALRV